LYKYQLYSTMFRICLNETMTTKKQTLYTTSKFAAAKLTLDPIGEAIRPTRIPYRLTSPTTSKSDETPVRVTNELFCNLVPCTTVTQKDMRLKANEYHECWPGNDNH